MCRGTPQWREAACGETTLRSTSRRRVYGVMQGAQDTARQSGAAGTAAASDGVCVMGWIPAAPKGPGRDSFADSVRSMTARLDAQCNKINEFDLQPILLKNYFLLASAISEYCGSLAFGNSWLK